MPPCVVGQKPRVPTFGDGIALSFVLQIVAHLVGQFSPGIKGIDLDPDVEQVTYLVAMIGEQETARSQRFENSQIDSGFRCVEITTRDIQNNFRSRQPTMQLVSPDRLIANAPLKLGRNQRAVASPAVPQNSHMVADSFQQENSAQIATTDKQRINFTCEKEKILS